MGSSPIENIDAQMVKLADTLDLGSSVARRAGSTPVLGTKV